MKVAMAMSGGVDSSLGAAILVEQGCKVTGVYLDCWSQPGCRVDTNRRDALKTGLKLGIKMKVLDFKKEYQEKVMGWFYEEIKKGRIPNPDVVCNQEIKFGMFLNWAMKEGFDKVATGHYVCVKKESGGMVKLMRSVDEKKDQSYFLAGLSQKQLSNCLFPVGGMTKEMVRLEAKKRGIDVWDKKSTSGICFINQPISFEELLKTEVIEHEGRVVDLEGSVVGKHKGVEFYTIGQRHGFKVQQKTANTKPLYIVKKMIKNNKLVVGSKKDLARKMFKVESWSLLDRGVKTFEGLKDLKVRIRHQGRLIGCQIIGRKVLLRQDEYGVAPGQLAVVYQDKVCLGSGVIS